MTVLTMVISVIIAPPHPTPGPDQLIQPQVLSNPAKSRRVTAHGDDRALCIVTTPQSPTLQWFHRDKTLRIREGSMFNG